MNEGLPDAGSLAPLESMARREWGGAKVARFSVALQIALWANGEF